MNTLCSICGQKFFCGHDAGAATCWCMSAGLVTSIEPNIGCKCPKCIGKPAAPQKRDVTWRLCVAYDGTAFHGWQKQAGLRTVEEVLSNGILRLTGQNPALAVAGRTDSGVHALAQAVSCRFTSHFDDRRLVLALSSILPRDLAVWRADAVPHGFNARRHAVGKRYLYLIDQNLAPSPFLHKSRWHLRRDLDLRAMQNAASMLEGEHDFESFRASSCDAAHARRYLWKVGVSKTDGLIRFDIRGNAFCHNMVRIIVGTLVDVGSGQLQSGDLADILHQRDRTKAGQTTPAHGLHLADVYYPDDLTNADIPSMSQFPRYPVTSETWGFNLTDLVVGRGSMPAGG